METINIEAVYEHGMLKLPHALPLPEGGKVTITVHASTCHSRRHRGLVEWKGSQADLDYLILADDNSLMEAS